MVRGESGWYFPVMVVSLARPITPFCDQMRIILGGCGPRIVGGQVAQELTRLLRASVSGQVHIPT
jgi:hypothetical protein